MWRCVSDDDCMLMTKEEKTMSKNKTHGVKKDITATVMLGVVFCVVAITVKLLLPTPNVEAYCDQMLKDTGLDFSQLSFSVERKFCEEKWIDAQVYFKLKVKGEDTDKVTNRLRSFPKYDGSIVSSSPPPAWWKPGSTAIKIVYFNNDNDNGSTIKIAYVEPPVNGSFVMYIQVIPL